MQRGVDATAWVEGALAIPHVRIASTHWEKFRGLMLERELAPDEALLLQRCNSVHTCFMKIPIDVLFLSLDGTVCHVLEEMRPWRFSPVVRRARHVLECCSGTAHRLQITVGTRVRVVHTVDAVQERIEVVKPDTFSG